MQIDEIKLAAAFRMIAEALEEQGAKAPGEDAPDTNVVPHPAAAAFGTPPETTWTPGTSEALAAQAAQAQAAQAQAAQAQAAQAQAAQAQAAQAQAAQAPVSLQPQIISSLQMMAQKMGPESVPAFLSSHGFNRVSEIPVERHSEILQAVMQGLQ